MSLYLKIKNYKIKNYRKKAFTLMELLIVVGITIVLLGVGISTYINQQRTKLLDTTAQEIVGYLRYAQQKSVSQEQGLQWGIHFDNPTSGNDFYALYTGTTYSSPIETKYLPAGMEFQTPSSGNSVNISFSKLTGLNYGGTEQELIVRLTTNQIARVIRTTANGLITSGEGEKGYWKFDEGSGNTASDNTIYKNTGTLVNSPTWKTGSDCVSGSCLSFDGVDDYVRVASPSGLDSTTFTLECWIYDRGQDGSYERVTSRGSDTFETAVATDGSVKYYPGWIDTGYDLTPNTWTHLAFRYDGSIMKLYANGVEKYSGSATISPTGALRIASRENASGATECFNGLIDEVRIYNRALSPAEILQHYNSRS